MIEAFISGLCIGMFILGLAIPCVAAVYVSTRAYQRLCK